MPLLGLIDWILITIVALLVWATTILIFLHWCAERFKFTRYGKGVYFGRQVYYVEANGQKGVYEPPSIHAEHRLERELKRKWYHELVLGI